MTAESAEGRLATARALLRGAGLEGEVDAVGLDGEIAAILIGPEAREPLARLAPQIRSLGFRYVALESRASNNDNEDS